MRQWPMAELTVRNGSRRHPARHEAPRARWPCAIAAGAVAGIAYIALQSVLANVIYGDSMWEPFHRIAAMALGPRALENSDVFDVGIVATAMAIHTGLAAFYGLVLSYLIVEFTRRNALWLGAVAGLLIYLVNYYGFVGLFPWMAEMRGWVTLVAHAVFGALLAACYWALYADRPAARVSSG